MRLTPPRSSGCGACLFVELLSLLVTQQKLYHHLQQVESLIPHNYIPYKLYTHWCTQHIVRSTYTCPRTVTATCVYCILHTVQQCVRVEYCCFHLISGTVQSADPDLVHRNRNRSPLSQRTVLSRCKYIIQMHPSQYSKPGRLYKYLLAVPFVLVADIKSKPLLCGA